MLSGFWHIELLGGLKACLGQQKIIRFRTQKAGALLAYLALHSGQVHTRESLVAMLWPDGEPGAGLHNLRMALLSLRRQLEPPGTTMGAVLLADRERVSLNPTGVTVDVIEFLAEIAAARASRSTAERLSRLSAAITLYQGPLLPACYEDWVLSERERLNELALQALHDAVKGRVHAGDLAGALEFARRAVTLDPLCEETHREVMRLCVMADRRDAALRQYRELERLLSRELGTRPSVLSRQMADRIRFGGKPVAGIPVPPPKAATDPVSPPAVGDTGSLLRAGTLTFLLLENATPAECGQAARDAWAAYRARVRRTWARYSGCVCPSPDGSCYVAFPRARDALACAVACQLEARRAAREGPAEFQVATALHTGDVDALPGSTDGKEHPSPCDAMDVLKGAERILGTCHPGQILCSEETASLLRRRPEDGLHVLCLGSFHLPGADAPERLYQVCHPRVPAGPFPPPKAKPGCPNNLLPQPTSYLGREDEIARLYGLLSSSEARLVTLTGSAGVGKTRLALRVAQTLVSEAHMPVWFVPVSQVTEPERIYGTILSALSAAAGGDVPEPEQVVRRLAGDTAVLILDCLDHLLPGAWVVVSQLLARVPALKCLVTSRRRLGMAGESVLSLAGLPVPGEDTSPDAVSRHASVRLFVDRVQMTRPDFQVTTANAAAVAALCRRLEGLPLAIELAAARAQVLTPAQMLRRVSEHLDWPADRRHTSEARHASLRTALDWGYRLLPPERQRVLMRLSVFDGGWRLDAAEALCPDYPPGAVLDAVAQLQAESFVVSEERATELRFRMGETLRQYAAQRLDRSGEADVVRRRHAQTYAELAERAARGFVRASHGETASGAVEPPAGMAGGLQPDYPNLRNALEWSLASDPELGLRLALALCPFWAAWGLVGDGCAYLERALARATDVPGDLRARAVRAAERLEGREGWEGASPPTTGAGWPRAAHLAMPPGLSLPEAHSLGREATRMAP